MAKVPAIEEIKNCNCAAVYLSSTTDKPAHVLIQGIFEQVSNDDEYLVIKTNLQYGIFRSSEVRGIHFYRL